LNARIDPIFGTGWRLVAHPLRGRAFRGSASLRCCALNHYNPLRKPNEHNREYFSGMKVSFFSFILLFNIKAAHAQCDTLLMKHIGGSDDIISYAFDVPLEKDTFFRDNIVASLSVVKVQEENGWRYGMLFNTQTEHKQIKWRSKSAAFKLLATYRESALSIEIKHSGKGGYQRLESGKTLYTRRYGFSEKNIEELSRYQIYAIEYRVGKRRYSWNIDEGNRQKVLTAVGCLLSAK
jgi:hypothetical protein